MRSPHTHSQPLHHVLEMAPALTHSLWLKWCLSRDTAEHSVIPTPLACPRQRRRDRTCTQVVWRTVHLSVDILLLKGQGICLWNQVQGPYSVGLLWTTFTNNQLGSKKVLWGEFTTTLKSTDSEYTWKAGKRKRKKWFNTLSNGQQM